MAGMTKMMLTAWIDAVLKPLANKWVTEGLPLEQLGGALIGYGIKVLRTGGWSDDRIQEEIIDVTLDR